MAETQTGAVGQLRKLLETQAAQDLSDGQLLLRFAAQRDESAFASLMKRHGPLVYGVCRHVLGHDQDAEDAFQGTFLVLARKAKSIHHQNSVAGWLHGVAYRVSLKARQTRVRRRHHEAQTAKADVGQAPAHEGWRELQAILDEELARLPEKFRTPFVLCVLEGKTKSEAARELHWREGTVSSRVARARSLLRTRLARRGVELSAVLCGLAVADEAARASLPSGLTTNTLKASLSFAGKEAVRDGVASVRAVALADACIRSMSLTRLKYGVALAAILLVAGTSAASYIWARPATPDGPDSTPTVSAPAPDSGRVEAGPPHDRLREMLVRGRVAGPQGRPVAGAQVAILADEYRQAGDRDFGVRVRRRVVVAGQTDHDGRFQFSTRPPQVGRDEQVYCLARGDKEAVAWQPLQTLVDSPDLLLKLEAAQGLRGKLTDAAGKPAAGVKIRVGGFRRAGQMLPTFAEETKTAAWPAAVVTDAAGAFTLTGLLPRCAVHLEIQDERYGPQWLVVQTSDNGVADAGILKLDPPRMLEGTVLADDTGQPLANAVVEVASYEAGSAALRGSVSVRTDAAGHFQVKPYPAKSLGVNFAGSPGSPFLAAYRKVDWPAGSDKLSLALRLQRGLLARGRVVEQGSDRPVVGARIQYRPMSGKNRNGDRGNLLVLWPWLDAASDSDGQFALPVLPGSGHLLVRAPGHDYIPMDVSERELIDGRKGGGRTFFPDALARLELDRDAEPAPMVIHLRRGVTIAGRVLRADGSPVASGFLVSRHFLGFGWETHSEFLPVTNGRFEVPGCDPASPEDYWFWDHKALQGAVVRFDAKQSDPVVHLAPFASASVRFIDEAGNVLRKQPIQVELVVRPGADRRDSWSKDLAARLTQNANFQGFQEDPKTGVISLRALIPGATYVVSAGLTSSPPFSVPAGENRRLPDVLVMSPKKPKRP